MDQRYYRISYQNHKEKSWFLRLATGEYSKELGIEDL